MNPKGVEKKKLEKKPVVERVLLISENDNISEMTLADAEKIAKKKGLYLCLDASTEHRLKSAKKVYKLETTAKHFGADSSDSNGEACKYCVHLFSVHFPLSCICTLINY